MGFYQSKTSPGGLALCAEQKKMKHYSGISEKKIKGLYIFFRMTKKITTIYELKKKAISSVQKKEQFLETSKVHKNTFADDPPSWRYVYVWERA